MAGERSRAGAFRAAATAVGVLLIAFAAFMAWRDWGAGEDAGVQPPAPPTAAEAQAEEPPPGVPPAPVDSPLLTVTRAAIVELDSSIDLLATVSSETCGSARGRAESGALLQQAETSALHVHDLIQQSVTLARASADSAVIDPRLRAELRDNVASATGRTLELAARLRDTRLQAIATARRLVLFMEQNAGGFEVQNDAVRFASRSAQVQFSHFQVNTARVLTQELLARNETAQALAEQQQLLEGAQLDQSR